MTNLIDEIQRSIGRKSELFLHDAVATGLNTVTVGQSTVPVTLPAIIPVSAGDFCQVLEQGPNRIILGPVGHTIVGTTAWSTITLSSGNWTQTRTPQWRTNGGRIELRGFLSKTAFTFPANSTLFATGGSNPPTPAQDYSLIGPAFVAALTPDSTTIAWQVDNGAATFRSSLVTHTLAVGDQVSLDGIWWPAS